MWINAELADYHVPVYAYTHSMEVIWLEEPDLIANPLGSKGIGEMGLIGTAAAIANAIFNATGKRVRDLPITPDKPLWVPPRDICRKVGLRADSTKFLLLREQRSPKLATQQAAGNDTRRASMRRKDQDEPEGTPANQTRL